MKKFTERNVSDFCQTFVNGKKVQDFGKEMLKKIGLVKGFFHQKKLSVLDYDILRNLVSVSEESKATVDIFLFPWLSLSNVILCWLSQLLCFISPLLFLPTPLVYLPPSLPFFRQFTLFFSIPCFSMKQGYVTLNWWSSFKVLKLCVCILDAQTEKNIVEL